MWEEEEILREVGNRVTNTCNRKAERDLTGGFKVGRKYREGNGGMKLVRKMYV